MMILTGSFMELFSDTESICSRNEYSKVCQCYNSELEFIHNIHVNLSMSMIDPPKVSTIGNTKLNTSNSKKNVTKKNRVVPPLNHRQSSTNERYVNIIPIDHTVATNALMTPTTCDNMFVQFIGYSSLSIHDILQREKRNSTQLPLMVEKLILGIYEKGMNINVSFRICDKACQNHLEKLKKYYF